MPFTGTVMQNTNSEYSCTYKTGTLKKLNKYRNFAAYPSKMNVQIMNARFRFNLIISVCYRFLNSQLCNITNLSQ